MRERMHAGSAAWTDAPNHLSAFSAATGDEAESSSSGKAQRGRQQDPNNARVSIDILLPSTHCRGPEAH